LNGLKKRFGTDRIDTVLGSHFHDDHVNGIPMLQRLFGAEVWAGENFADILEDPLQYDRPCLWHEPIRVHRRLPLGETFQWEEVSITLYPMSGHTRFATLICMEIDGVRVAHTGDQVFFRGGEDPYGAGSRSFTNHVYKNGLDVGCYMQTLADLKAFRPEWVLTGHTRPYCPDEAWFGVIEVGAQGFDDAHLSLMYLGDEDVHFGAESQGAKLKPYQMHAPDGGRLEFGGWVLNPFPVPQKATLHLVCPEGWQSEPVEVELGPREQKAIRVLAIPPPETVCRRQPVALDLTVGGQPFGQVTEALVTVGLPHF
jgi:glyoxylase-like metal-dependent hydrolase (beta-lactamase superfamily II)